MLAGMIIYVSVGVGGVLIGILLSTLAAHSTANRDLSVESTRFWALSPDRGRQTPIQFAVKREQG